MRGRYDKDNTVYYPMSKSTDGKMFFFLNPIGEIQSMLDHSSFVLEFTPFNSNPVEMHFDLTGLSSALKPLRDACSR
jgi:type VI secretion system protein VasI